MRSLNCVKGQTTRVVCPLMEGYIPSPLVSRGILRAISLVTSPQVYAY
jgi:hypothetical protein